jgi:hypothetical protein
MHRPSQKGGGVGVSLLLGISPHFVKLEEKVTLEELRECYVRRDERRVGQEFFVLKGEGNCPTDISLNNKRYVQEARKFKLRGNFSGKRIKMEDYNTCIVIFILQGSLDNKK